MILTFSFLAVLVIHAHASVSGIIDVTDKDHHKLLSAFTSGFVKLQPDDLSTLYYAAKGYSTTKTPYVKVFELDGCHHLETNYKVDKCPESTFHALSAWNLLSCKGKLHKDATVESMKAKLENPSSAADVHYAMKTLKLLNQPVSNPARVAQSLQLKLKEDDSLQSLGHAMHASALLGSHGKFILDRVEDVIVQADEVDGHMLQWEGGLTTTSLLLTGLHLVQGTKTLGQEQVDKFANYLLTRRSVQTARGALALLEAAEALSKSGLPPVCITLMSNQPVSMAKPELKVRVSDLLGNALSPTPTPVVAQSATRVTDDVVVLSKQPLAPGASPTEFVLSLNLEPGRYKIALTAGSHTANVITRVIGPLKLESVDIGIETVDGTQGPKLNTIQYPNKLLSNLVGDSNNNLIVKFNLPRPVHQAFLQLSLEGDEIAFIAERDSTKAYKVSVNLGTELTRSGTYKISLILGDAIMSNPINWNIGSIDVKLSASKVVDKAKRGPKPEIRHMFREAEKRPPQIVSLFFTAAAAAPLLLLLILWLRIGVPFNYFNFYSIPFHVGLAGILGLYTYFWLCGNMFTTCAWLLYIGGFTFISGNRLLRNIASKK